ncbi:MAG: sigma-70 family RNA polymerase sigma factor [Bacteroidales bacterium]|nr:sigma-70 family RNA polymerase sigma factor [Bacteroidales bacterium]
MTPDTSRHDAYCAFMRRHRSTVWHVCWRYARRGHGNRDDCKARAEDLAQEVWIVLWLKFDQLDPSASEARQRRWLEKLTETVILDLHRRQEPEPEPLTDELTDTLAIPGLDLSDTLFDRLALLPPDEQQLMQLRFEGYDAQEIADRLATTSGLTLSRDAVYQRISRIMKKLRQYKNL